MNTILKCLSITNRRKQLAYPEHPSKEPSLLTSQTILYLPRILYPIPCLRKCKTTSSRTTSPHPVLSSSTQISSPPNTGIMPKCCSSFFCPIMQRDIGSRISCAQRSSSPRIRSHHGSLARAPGPLATKLISKSYSLLFIFYLAPR